MRILVGLIEHMGDIVACEPVARYLKLNHPAAQLTWAVSPAYRELVDTNPHIDETLPVDCLTDWIKLTKHGGYDQIVDLHVNYRVCEHCRIPLIKQTGNAFVNVYEWFDYGTLQEALSLGAGLPPLAAQPQLYLKPEHAAAVDALGLPAEFCVVHRESNNLVKDWQPERWQGLLARVKSELGLEIVDVGAGAIAPPPLAVSGAITLFNRLPILQTAEVIRRARLFIGVDSGPAHLANAVRTPGVVLLGHHGYFRQYMPFNGFFASASPRVKMVRNLAGLVRDLSLDEVAEAVRYVVAAGPEPRDDAPAEAASAAPPRAAAKERRRLLAAGVFDPGWYGVHYPDAVAAGGDVIDHYLAVGRAEGRLPASPGSRGPKGIADGDAALAEPGSRLKRAELRQSAAATEGWAARAAAGANPGSPAAPRQPPPEDLPRTFAFYLPQFHPIPENDWAHGAGFSEWHNVVSAKPLFPGHDQPRVPGELGFYDLRSPEILHEQVALAREHGIAGFCFYYYYFAGKKLLYKPIDNYLKSKNDFPFFFLWANENWSRLWDGGDQELIIEQCHSPEDDRAFIRELLPIFADERYVKIGGRPILMVYKAHLFPDSARTTELWRDESERHGFPGLYLVMVDDWLGEIVHPREFGFDASYEIPSNLIPPQVLSGETEGLGLSPDFTGRIVDYPKFADFHLSRPAPRYKRFRTVMLPWDNTPRYGTRAIVHLNGRGEAYRNWLLGALIDTYRSRAPEERIVFLHSWNEWCEGTYLEPDRRLGRHFLEQTRAAIDLANEAIALLEAPSDGLGAVAGLLRVLQAKDEAAYRNLEATLDCHRELDRLRGELGGIYNSRAWHVAMRLHGLVGRLRRLRQFRPF
ncbi:MAG TPA: glycoside hydrolase family 99-like domain-containing protein [Stellaceae bacterium]|nr:glycoside hydrolase family 99-like domain-containing protein [Stellaceae bacterium]